ncbi:hypothetical protein [Demequina subtropica]|uniref:hypothetical protein n=1 Tax=Demequina subtropica TaxID=1638989 RepID=UPI0007814903|nr:hypothetical protein [Demequina subtropica]
MTHFIELPSPLAAHVDAGDVTVAELQLAVDDAVRRAQRFSTVTDAELETLLEGSGLSREGRDALRAAHQSPAAAERLSLVEAIAAGSLLADALTAQEAAARVGVTVSTITRRHERGALLAVRDARGRLRLPRWQFSDAGELPGWGTVAPHVDGVDLRTVEAFMSRADEDLDGLTPFAWLLAGRDPSPVAALADGLRWW